MNAGDEMVRGLGDVLAEHARCYPSFWGGRWNFNCGGPAISAKAVAGESAAHRAHVAEALAAHVLGLVAAGKAEALREAAKELPGFDGIRTHGDAARWLRDRAETGADS